MRLFFWATALILMTSCQTREKDGFVAFLESHPAAKFDLLIRGGSLIDGTGSPAKIQDVLIDGEEIAFVGQVDTALVSVGRVIEATGKVVSPGFIDAHAHGELTRDAAFENFLAMGVTSISLGQDGSSLAVKDINEWYEQATQTVPGVNIIPMVGHGTLRKLAGAELKTDIPAAILDSMDALLRDALEKGGFGMSTGLEYIPGTFAGEAELLTLAKTVGSYDGIIMSHMRNEDDDALEASIRELLVQGQHCKVHAAHLKSVYGKGEARAERILEVLLDPSLPFPVSADVYPYTASYTGIGILFPDWAKAPNDYTKVKKERRAELLSFLRNKVEARNGPSATLLGTTPYTGKTLADLAEAQNRPFEEVLMDIGPTGASGAYFVMDEALQRKLLLHPAIMVSSDGSPTMNHPRGYGSFSRIIEEYVLSESLLSLEEAIRKMSSLPAATFGILDRGIIRQGMKADLLVFDPEALHTRAAFENPHQLTEGMDLVLVNGHPALEKGVFSSTRSGLMLRKKMTHANK